jgi:hypothetical protein
MAQLTAMTDKESWLADAPRPSQQPSELKRKPISSAVPMRSI